MEREGDIYTVVHVRIVWRERNGGKDALFSLHLSLRSSSFHTSNPSLPSHLSSKICQKLEVKVSGDHTSAFLGGGGRGRSIVGLLP